MQSDRNSGVIFLRPPHIFKPLQTITAVILLVSLAGTGGSENGILWFVVISSFVVSLAATVIFALDAQDKILDRLTNGSLEWNILEMVYSFILGVLCVMCAWVAFGFANHHLGGRSAGYIVTGLFLIVQMALYGIPCVLIHYNSRENEVVGGTAFEHSGVVEAAHPYQQQSYQ